MTYKAFISYSHGGDDRLAPALQLALQRFAKPWHRLRNFRVFRDQTDLSATPHLWRNIQEALDRSEFFILIASEAAARSKWVAREIRHWLERRSPDTLLLVVTQGVVAWDEERNDFDWNRSTAVPGALKDVFQQEPLYVDFRGFDPGDMALANPVFRERILPIAATLHGMAPGDLAGEEVSRHRKAMGLARLAVASLFLLAVSTSVAAVWALRQRSLAEERRDEALRTQSLFLADLSRQKVRSGEGATAMRLALAALPQDPADPDRPWVVQAEAALYNALMSSWESAVLDAHETGDPPGVRQAVFSRDDHLLATVGFDGRVVVWDTRTGESVADLAYGESEHVLNAAFDPAGTRLVTGSRQGRVRVYDIDSGRQLLELVTAEPRIGIQMEPLPTGEADGLGLGEGMGARVKEVAAGGIAEEAGIRPGDVLTHLDGRPIEVFRTARPLFADVPAGAAVRLRLVRDGSVTNVFVTPVLHENDRAGPLEINTVRYSPDGRTILAADARVFRWDADTGRQLGALYGHRERVDHIDLVGGTSRVFTAGPAGYAFDPATRGGARIWSEETLAPAVELDYSAVETNDSGYEVSTARISPDGRRILTIAYEGCGLWDAETGRLIELTPPGGDSGDFSPDSRHFATAGGWDAHLWDARDGKAKVRFFGHLGDVRHVAFHPDGPYLVTASADKTARIWDIHTGRTLAVLRGHGDEVEYAAFGHDGRSVVTLSEDGTARLWRFGVFEKTVRNPETYRPDLRTVSRDGRRRIVRSRSGDALEVWDADRASPVRLAGHGGRIAHEALSPDGRWVYGVSEERRRLWDAGSGALRKVVVRREATPGTYRPGSDGVFSPDGGRLVLRSGKGETELWDPTTLRRVTRLSEDPEGVAVAEFSGDGRRLLTGGPEGGALWEAADGSLLYELEGKWFSRGFAIGPDGRRLARKTEDNAVELFSEEGRRIATLVGHEGPVDRMQFSPDSRLLATGGKDGSVRVWNAADGALLYRASALAGEFSSPLVFSDDGLRLLVAADETGTGMVLDAGSGAVAAVLRGHVGPLLHAVFSADGRRAITTSIDGTARLWDVDSGVELVKLGGESEFTREPNRFEPDKPSSGFFPDLSFLNHTIVLAGFSADGRQAFTLQRTGRLRIFGILTREELLANAREFARRPLNAEERRTYFLTVEETGTSSAEP